MDVNRERIERAWMSARVSVTSGSIRLDGFSVELSDSRTTGGLLAWLPKLLRCPQELNQLRISRRLHWDAMGV